MSINPISSPGTIPPANRAPTEMPPAFARMTMAMLGGLTRMFTCASPPRTRPISRRLSSTSRSVMVALVISSPVSMKKGIAVSGRPLIASNIWFGTRLSGAASVSST